MKWQGDGLHKQHPPRIDNNPTVYSAVGQSIIVFSSPVVCSVNISTLTSAWQRVKRFARGEKNKLKKTEKCFFPVFHQ